MKDVHDSTWQDPAGTWASRTISVYALATANPGKPFSDLPANEAQERLTTVYNLEKQRIKYFQTDVLRFARQFDRPETDSERLNRVRGFFRQSEFNKARKVLEAELRQIRSEQSFLLNSQREDSNETLPGLKSKSVFLINQRQVRMNNGDWIKRSFQTIRKKRDWIAFQTKPPEIYEIANFYGQFC